MSYKPVHTDSTLDDAAAAAAIPLILWRNLRELDEDRPSAVAHGWSQSEDADVARPKYITAPFDVRFLPPIVLMPAAGQTAIQVRVVYVCSGSSDTELEVLANGRPSGTPQTVDNAGTVAMTGVFDLPVDEGLPVEINLRVDTNGPDYSIINAKTGKFEPVGIVVAGVGGSLRRSDPSGLSIDQPMYASSITAIELAQWALYRGRRWVFSGQPDDSVQNRWSIARGELTQLSLPMVGCLIRRRADAFGASVRLWVTYAGGSPPDVTARWYSVSGTQLGVATVTPLGGRSREPDSARDGGISSWGFLFTDEYEEFVDALDSRAVPNYLRGMNSVAFDVDWPSGLAEDEVVALHVEGGQPYVAAWGAQVVERMDVAPPLGVSQGSSSGVDIPPRWQPVNTARMTVYPRTPLRGGKPDTLNMDFAVRALCANDRLIRATRFPVVLSRYRHAGWTHTATPTTVSPAEVVFDGVPFLTSPGMTSLDVTTWAHEARVTVAALTVAGASADSVVLTHSSRNEQEGTLTGLSGSTWYRLTVTLLYPDSDGTATLYGIFVAGTALSSV